jgi:hypothetical protein
VYSSSFANERWPDIAVGEDVFMLGLFIDQSGHEHHAPLARFGNISMLASKSSRVAMGSRSYESYIVDMRSRSGFSGSPVFAYRTFGTNLQSHTYEAIELDLSGLHLGADSTGLRNRQARVNARVDPMVKLLGIHYAQFHEPVKLQGLSVIDDVREEIRHLVTGETFVQGLSGMTCVAPAWKIEELLECEALAQERQRIAGHEPPA